MPYNRVVLIGYFDDDSTRIIIDRDDDDTCSYSVVDRLGEELWVGSGFADEHAAMDAAREHDEVKTGGR